MTTKPDSASGAVPEFQGEVTACIANFLRSIGLEVRAETLSDNTFMPGMEIRSGALLIDESRLIHPGDLLHEAGHLAILPPEKRRQINGDVGKKGHEEMAAIAWSWAALTHLGLEPSIVFHPEGYKGDSKSIIENFSNGRTFGVPILQWMGLSLEPRQAQEAGKPPYPHMLAWVVS